jgi:hypothetical protein
MKVDINNKHVRFSEAQWYNKEMPEVTLGGVGGIGSWLAILLGRLGVSMYIHDFDLIDETNMAGQAYSLNQIGSPKMDAVEAQVKSLCGDIVIEKMGLFTKDSFVCPIVFSAFDNMSARKLMFEKWKENPDRELFIDGRMLMEQGMVFFITPGREVAYEEHLFDDSEVQDQPCSAKATSHSGAQIASLMTAGFTNYLANKSLGFDVRDVPFKFDYNFQLMMFGDTPIRLVNSQEELLIVD